jgi:hypothetical protein
MIMIPVDEADAFDRLSIAELKGEKQVVLRLYSHIAQQITFPTMELIVASTCYANLVVANQNTFNWVEKAKRNECTAQDVDRANYQRYLAKKALQEKFFPKSSLTETKTERHY